MGLQPGADRVALTRVEHVALTVQARSQQQIHPGLCQLRPHFDLRQQRAREHKHLANPVGLFDDTQAVGVTVGYEDSKGERGYIGTLALTQLLKVVTKLSLQKSGITAFKNSPN